MNAPRLIKLKIVLEYCAFSRATLYRQIKAGHFPEPVRLTGSLDDAIVASRSVAWREEEILQWIANRQKVPLSETRRVEQKSSSL
ncbi:AlpA family phage regulatory protein [Salmonella enterica subsp. enterica serovar Agama]|uniref:helix-turn-helix transcriptional regulator n=1 Tax=Salmonella enterica TaxID=28901 RepID=UPI0009AA43BE|nr:AlpA family phage regulatory protein [Salmonella enterica]EAA8812194.1 AlpA family phage regulatory protein [Salmonella enterica subsp. enterica]EAA9213795.1 AlpA family phage regulatory protein [Salmonella enterica subsp. enterica serovar Agama]EAZ9711111.1 AlpA family phage regulatory protein [Salmonella enterica subsp. enterica serovar Typhimurium]EBH9100881.1 AlpA family phage regulatory protein [Salmonella enterica subsp. enterica serovar Colindale]ECF6101812.1 AlpA family phage regula